MTGFHNLKRWLFILALIVLNVLVLTHFSVGLFDILKFFLFTLLFTLIPGLLLLDWIGVYKRTAYKFALAAAIGICLDIVLYIILSVLQVKILLYFIFAIIFLLYLVRKNHIHDIRLMIKVVENLESKYFLYLSLLSTFVLALTVVIYFVPNPLPGSVQSIIYYVDYPWHLGNIAEIKNHWYPQDPRLAGNTFHYHVFVYVYTALIAFLSNITIPVIFFRLYIIFFIYLLFFAAYFSGSRWFNKRGTGILNIVIFFFAGTCLLSPPFNIFLKNLFFSPTFLIATVLMLFLILEIREYITTNDKSNLLLILILVFGVSGSKGSFFPVLFSGFLACFIYSLLIRQANKRLNILVLSSFIVFFVVFNYIFKGPGSEGINIVPFEIIRNTFLFDIYSEYWAPADEFWAMLSFIPVYFIAFFSFRALAFMNLLKNLLSSIRRIPLDNLFMASVVLASFIPGYLLSYRGSSQYYYLFVGYICLNLISAGYLYEVFKRDKSSLIKLLIILLLLGSAFDTSLMIKNNNYINSRLMTLQNKPLTAGLYEGLTFLRDNTDEDSIIASYRALLSKESPRFYYYSAFSERRILVEGWQYMSVGYQEEAYIRYEDMKKLYNTRDVNTAASIIVKYNISYLIVDKNYRQKLKFEKDKLLIQRFENDEVEIYQTVGSGHGDRNFVHFWLLR